MNWISVRARLPEEKEPVIILLLPELPKEEKQ